MLTIIYIVLIVIMILGTYYFSKQSKIAAIIYFIYDVIIITAFTILINMFT